MTDLFSLPAALFRRALPGRLLLLAALALPLAAVAQEEKDSKTISEKVSEGLGKIKPLTDAKDWPGSLALIESLQKIAKPGGSYEEALLFDIKAKIYLQNNQFSKAIAPMESALQLSDLHGYFDDKYESEMAKFLTQLYYQEAIAPGRTKQQQAANFEKAGGYIKRVIDHAGTKASPDDIILYASILFNRASSNPDKVDMALIKEAQKVVQGALVSVIHPKTQFYEFLLATYTQQADYLHGAEILELLVKANPSSTGYWPQLAAMYLSLGNDEKDKQKSLENNVRAILTIERAQAVGQMKSPKDNYNLISMYLLIGQFERACEMLDTGLRNGTVDQEQKNWETLAYYYQQVNKEMKAIDILKEASKRYPKAGQLNFQAAQIYYSIDKLPEAYQESRNAALKGVGENKAAQVWQFVSYCAFELQKLPEALEAVNNAITASEKESKQDAQLPKLKQAIEEALKERDAEAEAMKAKQKL